jgi:Na+/H+ antiporter
VHGLEFRLEFLIGLIGVVALLAQLARMVGVPYPIFLVLGGVGVGLVPAFPDVDLPPEIIFLVFIPPLLLSAAISSSPRDLFAHARPIGLLAVGLVLLTTGTVATVSHFVVGLPWAAAFVLGAVVAPTDPVAAGATFRRLGVPDRVQTIVSGESIINDGTALVAYNIAVVAVVTGTFSVAQAGLEFLLVSGGGILLGAVVALLVTPLYARLSDPTILVVFTLIPAYFAYIAAERLGASGILAVVTLGLYVGWQAPKLFTARARVQSTSFWEVLTFLMDSLLFILVGLEFPVILRGMSEYSFGQLLLYATLVCGAVIGLRLLWFLLGPSSFPRPRPAAPYDVFAGPVAGTVRDGLERDARRGLPRGGAGHTPADAGRGRLPPAGPHTVSDLRRDLRHARLPGAYPPPTHSSPRRERRGSRGPHGRA